MRTPAVKEAEWAAHAIDPHPPREPRDICPPTPPPENGEGTVCDTVLVAGKDDGATDGNSAAALNIVQDRSLYMTPEGEEKREEGAIPPDPGMREPCGNEKDMLAREEGLEIDTSTRTNVAIPGQTAVDAFSMPTPESITADEHTTDLFRTNRPAELAVSDAGAELKNTNEAHQDNPIASVGVLNEHDANEENEVYTGSAEMSTAMEYATTSDGSSDLPATPPFDFSTKRLYPHYPSSFLRPGSKFSGTQQSDRQIYNVDVKVLTLSVPQSTMTGYLRICGLTEDHPTLTTFFTGEIIGGPTHKHTFQTKDPSWGATDRTDLQHWARFPAWRHLSKDAKRDINFKYPPPATGLGSRPTSSSSSSAAILTDDIEAGGDDYNDESNPGWWTQPNIFMRWKEWFLVPDHRVRSIQGASFEGFYYICFNQVEGNINGIYFHAKSEK